MKLSVGEIAARTERNPILIRQWLREGRLRGRPSGSNMWSVSESELVRFRDHGPKRWRSGLMRQRGNEQEFRELIRGFLARRDYPSHQRVIEALDRPGDRHRSGLSELQGVWRREEVEAQGYDWEASKSARTLVRKDSR
jgi:hypothetical protein